MAAEELAYKDYRVAVQIKSTDPIYIITVRENDIAQLLPFIARVYSLDDYTDFAHLDVHLQLPNGSVAVIYESGEWPKGVRTIRHEGFVVRGKAKTMRVGGSSAPPTTAKAASTAMPMPPPAAVQGFKYMSRVRYTTIPVTLTA